MSSDGAEKLKKFSPGRSLAWENYEGFENSDDEEEMQNDVFVIPPKKASLEELRKWRQPTLALNKARRFRYTLDLKRAEEREHIIRRFRVTLQAARVFKLFCKNAQNLEEAPPEGFGIGQTTLSNLAREDLCSLQQLGGVNEVANLLRTDLEKGIKDVPEEIQRRLNAYGENSYPRKAARNFLVFVWEALKDMALIILMVCAALLFVFGKEGIKEGWLDGGSIYFTVILHILVIAINDYREYLLLENINEEKRKIQLQVIRDGRRSKVSIFDLVVGDVVPLNIGDQVPADGIIIEGHSLSIDESSLTGESKFVYKDKKSPFMISGCKVADGYGTMLVTAVGLNTEWGLVMASIPEDNGEETPLQVRLNGVATFIGKVGLTVAVMVFVTLLLRFFTGNTKDSSGNPMFQAGKTKLGAAINGIVKIIAIAVTIVIVAVPEGLALAVILILAYLMEKMLADKALVRRLSACETMGSATTICIGKTGTVTLNQMTVVKASIAGKIREPSDSLENLPSVVQVLLVEGISQNTTGSVYKPKGGGEMEVTGSPTEKAILSWALMLGMDFDNERSKSSILHVFTFNSEKKRRGVALKRSDTEVHIHWKGAAEIILGLCKTWIDSSGSLQEMTPNKVDENKQIIEGMAAATLRCIAFAYRTYDLDSVPIDEEQIQSWQILEDDLTLLAIVGMKNPCRPNVREAVITCQKAGVKVRMVTGDDIYTAKATALECGILQEGQSAEEPTIIEGRDFRNYTEEERLAIVDEICVMGRSSPTDKLYLVQALRKKGHVVAVTGNGRNDAPALQQADIGLSMGIQGTEVAKESSDIIILDDNFASVVKVVWWGRSVYANIQKIIQFQLTVIVAALPISFVAAASSGDLPWTDVQLLWVNLIMDTLGVLALATEAPTDLMHRPPLGRREPVITNRMWINIIVQAFYQVAVLLTLTFKGIDILNLKQDNIAHANKVINTVIFNACVLWQIFNQFNSRKPDQINIFRGLLSSHLFVGITSVTLVLQVLIVEFVGKIASTTPLNCKQWIICIVIGLISWPLAAIFKLIPVPEKPFMDYFRKKSRRQFRELSSISDRIKRTCVSMGFLWGNKGGRVPSRSTDLY